MPLVDHAASPMVKILTSSLSIGSSLVCTEGCMHGNDHKCKMCMRLERIEKEGSKSTFKLRAVAFDYNSL